MVDVLLDPIAGEHPAGDDLKYGDVYAQIRHAKRFDPLAYGPYSWSGPEPHLPDWHEVISIASGALKDKSKDLQLATWLTEAWLHTDGLLGLARGFRLLTALVRSFWDCGLHPALEDPQETTEFRNARFEWLNENVPALIMNLPLAIDTGYSFLDYEKSPGASVSLYETSLDGLQNDLALALMRFGKLQDVLNRKLGDAMPDLTEIRKSLDRCNNILGEVMGRPAYWSRILAPEPAQMLDSVLPEETQPEPVEPILPAAVEPGDGFGQVLASISNASKQEALAALTTLPTECGRDEFRRRLAVAEICLGDGHAETALGILQELADVIQRHQLEHWEGAEFIGRALLLLHRCCFERGDKAGAAQALRSLCRIDPTLGIRAEAAQQAFRPR